MGTLRFLVTIALVLGAWDRPARAYDFEVTSRTEAYAYQLRRYDRDGLTFLNRRRLAQYLGLRVFNLWDPGQQAYKPGGGRRPPTLLYLHTLMRFFADFGDFARPLVSSAEHRTDGFDLLLGALEGRNLWGYVDFTLGRQYDAELMDFFAYDGLRLRINSPFKVFVEGHFGMQVDRARPFSPAVFETDGTSGEDEDDEAVGPTFGVAVGVEDPGLFQLRLAYRGVASRAAPLAADPTESADEQWGIDQELLFASTALRIPGIDTVLSGGLRYSLLTGQFDDLQASLVQRIGSRQRIEAEALHSRPHFDGDSIFNVFGIEPFNEVAGRYSVRVWRQLLLEARAGYRWFWRDAELEESTPAALSASATGAWRTPRLYAALELFFLGGLEEAYAGRRYGGDLSERWLSPRWFFGRRIGVEGRLTVVHFEQTTKDSEPLTTVGLQAGAELRLLPEVRLHLLLEDNINRYYDSALRVLAILDMGFRP